MRKKVKMNLGGIPPNVGNLFNIASYLQGQKSLPSSGEGLDVATGYDNSVFSTQPLGAPASLTSLGPNTVTSSAYGVLDKNLQGLSDVPQQTLDQIGPLDELNPFGNQKFFPGSFEADQMMLTGVNLADRQIAMPANEFDQAEQAVNIFKRGRDAIRAAREAKKAADIAKAGTDVAKAGTDVAAQGAQEAVAQTAGSKMGNFLSSGAGAATSAAVGILGKYIQERDKKDGNYSTEGAMGGGALQGAAIGSALGPLGTVVGGAIGAGVGYMQKSKFDHNAEMQKLTDKTEEAKDLARGRLAGRAILNTYPVEGIKDQVYAYGGHTNDPDYIAEGGEMIQHAPGDLPKTDNNGSVTPITKTIARINGDKHTAPSGGVGMEGNESARIYSDQLYVPADLIAELYKF